MERYGVSDIMDRFVATSDTPRKRVLLDGLR